MDKTISQPSVTTTIRPAIKWSALKRSTLLILIVLVLTGAHTGCNDTDPQRFVLELDGINGFVETGLLTDDLPDDVTFEAWIFIPEWMDREIHTVFGGYVDDHENRWNVSINMGHVTYEEWGGTGATTTGPRNRQWTHVAVVREGGQQAQVFVNGVETREHEIQREKLATGANVHIGARPLTNGETGDFFHGQLANARIWEGRLSQDQIRQSMLDDPPGDAVLIADWRFNEGEGDLAEDHSGNGHDAGLVNAGWRQVDWQPSLPDEEPVGLLLTWQRDPSSTMTIDWHVQPYQSDQSSLEFKPVGSDQWQHAGAESLPYPFSQREIRRIELENLQPDTEYRFRIEGFSRTYQFRTMPASLETTPVTFAAGGDVLNRHRAATHPTDRRITMSQMNRTVRKENPAFITWGGDLAYADGLADQTWRWYLFFTEIMDTLIDEDGNVIPIVAAIGNHEVNDDGEAPYYTSLFAFPGESIYDVLDFNDYMSLILLDTDHAKPVEGDQTTWLGDVLAEREGNVAHLFPVYHVPAFPSHRSFTGGTNQRVRDNWSPLFEQYGVRVAFENHDHTYKRTPPIRRIDEEFQIQESGVTYIGDGSWGLGPRSTHDPEETWYLERADSTFHAIMVTLFDDHATFRIIDEQGNQIDEYDYDVSR